MTANELGSRLRDMYETKGAYKTTMIHLFGIVYADEMVNAGIKPADVLKVAQMSEKYVTEIYKGMRLSQYVALKEPYASRL